MCGLLGRSDFILTFYSSIKLFHFSDCIFSFFVILNLCRVNVFSHFTKSEIDAKRDNFSKVTC